MDIVVKIAWFQITHNLINLEQTQTYWDIQIHTITTLPPLILSEISSIHTTQTHHED